MFGIRRRFTELNDKLDTIVKRIGYVISQVNELNKHLKHLINMLATSLEKIVAEEKVEVTVEPATPLFGEPSVTKEQPVAPVSKPVDLAKASIYREFQNQLKEKQMEYPGASLYVYEDDYFDVFYDCTIALRAIYKDEQKQTFIPGQRATGIGDIAKEAQKSAQYAASGLDLQLKNAFSVIINARVAAYNKAGNQIYPTIGISSLRKCKVLLDYAENKLKD